MSLHPTCGKIARQARPIPHRRFPPHVFVTRSQRSKPTLSTVSTKFPNGKLSKLCVAIANKGTRKVGNNQMLSQSETQSAKKIT